MMEIFTSIVNIEIGWYNFFPDLLPAVDTNPASDKRYQNAHLQLNFTCDTF